MGQTHVFQVEIHHTTHNAVLAPSQFRIGLSLLRRLIYKKHAGQQNITE